MSSYPVILCSTSAVNKGTFVFQTCSARDIVKVINERISLLGGQPSSEAKRSEQSEFFGWSFSQELLFARSCRSHELPLHVCRPMLDNVTSILILYMILLGGSLYHFKSLCSLVRQWYD